MQGLDATFKMLVDLAQKAVAPTVMAAPGEPEGVYYLVVNGVATRVQAANPLFAGRAMTLAAIVELAAVHKATAEIWFNDDNVTCLFSGRNREPAGSGMEGITLDLQPSPQLKWFEKISADDRGVALDQKQLVRLLRTLLFGKVTRPGDFPERIRKVSFEHAKKSEGEIKNNKSVSLGKNITAQLGPDVKLDEETIEFSIPVFDNPALNVRVPVLCDFDVDPPAEKFVLTPLPGELLKARQLGCDWIMDQLKTGLNMAEAPDVPIYRGWPKQEE